MDLTNKRIMAIDYGRKFSGLATFKFGVDPFVLMHGRLAYESDEKLISELAKIIDEEFIDILIVGVPYFTDGKASKMTETIQKFIKELREKITITVKEVDETLTTFEAEDRMKNDPRFNFKVDMKQIDALSAVVILEEFLKSFSD